MFRFLFAALLLVHGLTHLLGFVSQWHFATISQMTGKTLLYVPASLSKGLGLFWLLACIGFVLVCAGYWLQHDWWLSLALASLVLSQVLIVLYWTDAKAGTVANGIILLVIALTFQRDFSW